MIFERDPLFTVAFDKLASREYVADRVGESILPAMYHVSDDAESIPFRSLSDSYVIKSSLGSGRVFLVDEGTDRAEERLQNTCIEWLSDDYYLAYATMLGNYNLDYDELEANILVEERLTGKDQDLPRDYKFYVFHGRVEYVHVDFDRFGDHSTRFFDREWNPQDFRDSGLPLGPPISKPSRYEEMVTIAETLGEEFDFVRVDLYRAADDRIVFGELTPTPSAGRAPFDPQQVDFELGDLW